MPSPSRHLPCSLACLPGAFQLPRPAAPMRCLHAAPVDLLESTLRLANAEEALGGVIGYLPFIAIPGVVLGIPFLAYKRLESVDGEAYTETVFTEKAPPRQREPVMRKKDEDMTYAELEAKYGETTSVGGAKYGEDEPAPAKAPDAPFAFPNPVAGGAEAAPPAYDAPPPAEEEYKLPSFPNPFGGPPAREPVFADEEEDEPAAEEPFKFPWQ